MGTPPAGIPDADRPGADAAERLSLSWFKEVRFRARPHLLRSDGHGFRGDRHASASRRVGTSVPDGFGYERRGQVVARPRWRPAIAHDATGYRAGDRVATRPVRS